MSPGHIHSQTEHRHIDSNNQHQESTFSKDEHELGMATLTASASMPNVGMASVNSVSKRYRPAPAKTFQCRGYGECRMVFSRSEHLARHIRKHTGERPFTCHCGKQFSRLDNLRQHAQTVHSDKQDMNEQMMRDLTTLHATMAAAGKSNGRSTRRNAAAPKQDEPAPPPPPPPISTRPGTSTGYEGGSGYEGGYTNWSVSPTTPSPSFRDSESNRDHSFRGIYSVSNHDHSFRSSNGSEGHSFRFSASAPPAPPTGTFTFTSQPPSSSRPGTSGPTLPPLASVVSATFSGSSPPPISSGGIPPIHAQSTQQLLPLRRPSTSGDGFSRPGTAPGSFFSVSGYVTSGRLGSRGGGGTGIDLLSAPKSRGGYNHSYYDEPSSPSTGYDPSPFSFHPPPLSSSASSSAGTTLPTLNSPLTPPSASRKRTYAESEDRGGDTSYDYESESRPQSRRLSIMELCNSDGTAGGGGASRPGTATGGLALRASALALVDHRDM